MNAKVRKLSVGVILPLLFVILEPSRYGWVGAGVSRKRPNIELLLYASGFQRQ